MTSCATWFWLTAVSIAWATEPTEMPRLSWAPKPFLQMGYGSAPWINDPFYPDQKKLRLMAIIAPEKAYINGLWVRKGEDVDGYTVIDIRPGEVLLSRRGEAVVLRIKEVTP